MTRKRNISALPFKKRKFREFAEDLPQQNVTTNASETPMIPINRIKRIKSARRRLFGPFDSNKSAHFESSSREEVLAEPLDLKNKNRNSYSKSQKSPLAISPSSIRMEEEKSQKFVFRYPLANSTSDLYDGKDQEMPFDPTKGKELADISNLNSNTAFRAILFQRIIPYLTLETLVTFDTEKLLKIDKVLRIDEDLRNRIQLINDEV